MAIGVFTDIPVDALPASVSPYTRGDAVENIAGYLGSDVPDDIADDLSRLVQDMRLSIMTAMVQDAVEDAGDKGMVDEIMSYRFLGDSTYWSSFDAMAAPYISEAEGILPGAGQLIRTLAMDAVDAVSGFIAGGATRQRKLARMVIAMRFTGMLSSSWEDISIRYNTAEKTIREEMRKFNLPTSHI